VIPRSTFRIELELKEEMREAVRQGKADNMTDLIRKALKQFLEKNS